MSTRIAQRVLLVTGFTHSSKKIPGARSSRTPHAPWRRRAREVVEVRQATAVDEVRGREETEDDVYSALKGQKAWLVSRQERVEVTSLWTATEKCILVFARSMGCVFCQEYARQLKRDVLPKLEGTGIRLYLISIGTAERGVEFADLTEFPQSQLLADPENVLYDAVGLIRNVQRTFFDIRTPLSIFGRAFRNDKGADLVEATTKWKPWIPPKGEQALQQGGIFVFDGTRCVFKHIDQATADHYNLQDLLSLVLEN